MPKKLNPNGKAAQPAREKPAPAKKTAAKKPRSTTKLDPKVYVRNIRGMTVRATLDSTTERRIELKPRGQRGDMIALKAEESEDPAIEENLGLLWEVLDAETAKGIAAKQRNNESVTTPFDMLTNPNGQPYEKRQVVVEEPYEQQGEVVAEIQDGGQGRYTESTEQLVRKSGAPEQVHPPGSLQYPVVEIPSHIPPEQQADYVARQLKGAEIPAGDVMRGMLKVDVGPTQREL